MEGDCAVGDLEAGCEGGGEEDEISFSQSICVQLNFSLLGERGGEEALLRCDPYVYSFDLGFFF